MRTKKISQIHRHLYFWSLCLLGSDTKTEGSNKKFYLSKEEMKTQMKGSQGAEVLNSSFRGV